MDRLWQQFHDVDKGWGTRCRRAIAVTGLCCVPVWFSLIWTELVRAKCIRRLCMPPSNRQKSSTTGAVVSVAKDYTGWWCARILRCSRCYLTGGTLIIVTSIMMHSNEDPRERWVYCTEIAPAKTRAALSTRRAHFSNSSSTVNGTGYNHRLTKSGMIWY